MANRAERREISVEAFLAWAETLPDGQRAELVDGEIVMMTGGSMRHAEAIGRLLGSLFAKLSDGPCRVLPESAGLQVDDSVFYPDASVHCSDEGRTDKTRRAPSLIFEVLSPSTRLYDLNVKAPRYMRIPGIVAAVMFDLESPTIYVFRPDQIAQSGAALPEIAAPDAELVFPLAEDEVAFNFADLFAVRP